MEFAKTQTAEQCEVSIKGKITFSDHIDFKGIIMSVNDNKFKNVVVDISNVEFIDSAALGMMLLLRDETEKSSTNLVLRGPKGQVKKMFQISRFYELFNIID